MMGHTEKRNEFKRYSKCLNKKHNNKLDIQMKEHKREHILNDQEQNRLNVQISLLHVGHTCSYKTRQCNKRISRSNLTIVMAIESEPLKERQKLRHNIYKD
jgi:hypothetical protein